MVNNNYILTADVGACSLKMAEFLQDEGKLILVNFAYVEYAVEAGEEIKITELQKTFISVIERNKFKAKKLYLSISGQSVFTRFVKLPMHMKSKRQKIEQLVNYEARQNIPFPIEEVTWDYQTIHSSEDRSDEISVMFAVIKTNIINELVNVFEKEGFETVLIGTSPTSSYNCMCALKINEDAPSALINIGSKCTNIVFIDKGKFFARVIPLGGHSVTQQISKEMEISFAEAEKLKKNEGFIPPGKNHGEGYEKTKAISEIIRNVMLRIHGEIVRSINVYESQQPENNVSKIYLAGGSSILKYTDHFLAEKLGLRVEYLNAFKLVSISDNVDRNKLAGIAHMFPELLGLAVNSVTSCPIEISLLPIAIKKQHAIKEKKPYFFAIAGIVIMCLVIVYWGLYTQKKLLNNLIANSTGMIEKIQSDVVTVKNLNAELEVQKTVYNNLAKMLNNRNSWFVILDSIQKSLPDNSWVILLEPTGKPIITATTQTSERTNAGLIFDRQRLKQNVTTTSITSDSIEWIKVKVNTLMLFQRLKSTEAEDFKEQLLKQPCFTNNADEIVIVDYKTPIRDSDNISSFEIIIRLKTPIPNK